MAVDLDNYVGQDVKTDGRYVNEKTVKMKHGRWTFLGSFFEMQMGISSILPISRITLPYTFYVMKSVT